MLFAKCYIFYVIYASCKRMFVFLIDRSFHYMYHFSAHLPFYNYKGVRALRGKFGPIWSKKLKIAFHQFHLIVLFRKMVQVLNSGIYFTFSVAMVTKMADKVGLK